jgi:hypothetical protein
MLAERNPTNTAGLAQVRFVKYVDAVGDVRDILASAPGRELTAQFLGVDAVERKDQPVNFRSDQLAVCQKVRGRA